MNKKVQEISKEVLEKFSPSKKDLEFIKKSLKKFLENFEKEKNKLKINAEIFIGGSYAKKTLIKKERYDIDIFLRFDKKYEKEDLSKLTQIILKKFKGVEKIHGSRDYFRMNVSPSLFFEIVPVFKAKNSKEALNITDLSYLHVKYLNKKIKSKKILNDIIIAKAFTQARNCYGAESYINGFSGYSLELLVYYYGSFTKFLRGISKIKSKEIIDIEKLHKKKSDILLDLNSAKLHSPIILIDPTYKQRNALASLSYETFKKFQKDCKNFLNKPSIKYFEKERTNVDLLRKKAKEKNFDFILLKAKTNRQAGDIAGSKLFKFYNHLAKEIRKYFELKEKYFEYDNKNSAEYVFLVKAKKEVEINGPFIGDKKNIKLFKKKYKKTFVKKNKIYAWKKIDFGIKAFLKNWSKDNSEKMNDMGITTLRVD